MEKGKVSGRSAKPKRERERRTWVIKEQTSKFSNLCISLAQNNVIDSCCLSVNILTILNATWFIDWKLSDCSLPSVGAAHAEQIAHDMKRTDTINTNLRFISFSGKWVSDRKFSLTQSASMVLYNMVVGRMPTCYRPCSGILMRYEILNLENLVQ